MNIHTSPPMHLAELAGRAREEAPRGSHHATEGGSGLIYGEGRLNVAISLIESTTDLITASASGSATTGTHLNTKQ